MKKKKDKEKNDVEEKFIKNLKVRKRLLSPGAINFHLHFIFVSFVPPGGRPGRKREKRRRDRNGCIAL